MAEFASLVLFARNLEACVAFYHALGIALVDEHHGEGPVHAAADLDGIHFAVYPAEGGQGRAPQWRYSASTFPGFFVSSLDDVTTAVTSLGAPIVHAHEQRPWGCRIIAEDPDGRPVEVNQRGHCG